MSDKLDMDELKEKSFAKKTRLLVLAESLVILALLAWASSEYESNAYLQDWANANIGPISFLLNGTLAGIYAGAILGYMIAKYFGQRTEEEKILEKLTKKRVK